MKKIILTLLSTFLLIPFLKAQQTVVFEEWKTDAGSQSFFFKSKTVTDGSGNVYITGATKNGSGDYDILTAKYNSSGVQQWIVQYNGAGNGDDGASALLVDGSGNVFITGTYYKDATDSNNYVTIKYNSSGTQQWLSTYNGTGSRHDAATAMCFDASGNIYVTGTSWGSTSLYDYATVKYNSSGTQQWASRYNYNGNMDVATKMTAGSTITVSGASENSSGNWSLATVQYNLGTGAQVGSASRSSGTGTGMDNVTDIFQDASGNIYVTGGVVNSFKGFDYSTIKFNSSLAVQWNVEYNGNDSLDDVASSVAVDGSGNVYVTGYSTTLAQGTNYVTIKYNSSGTLQWKKTYNGAGNSSDSATALVINASSDVIVTGSSINNVGNKDFYTIKYKSDSTILWQIGFDGLADLEDVATDIAVDNLGDIIVAGQSRLTDSTFEYATIKYTQKSILIPADTTAISNFYSYVENRGQLTDTDTLTVPQVKYYNAQLSPAVYFTDTSLSYVFARLDTAVGVNDSLHRVDMICDGANVTKVRAMDMQEDYSNFFLEHIPSGRGRVPHYQRLVYPNIYNYIDLLYGSNSMGMKYYFVVKPNTGGPSGNVADIDLVYNGADSLSIGGSGELIIYTPLGNIVHPRPKAFKDSAGIFVSLYWQPTYSLTGGNHIAFNVGTYNPNVNLILQVDYGDLGLAPNAIDNLNWSTCYGGNISDFFDDTKSSATNLFVAGSTQSANFPVTNGVWNGNYGGSYDAVALKFKTSGEREWSTFYGGSDTEQGEGIAIDQSGNVFIVGKTRSTNLTMISPNGAYLQPSNGAGGSDGFIVKLVSGGNQAPWRTFYGGSSSDLFHAIEIDSQGNIYVVGQSNSTDFPVLNPLYSYAGLTDGVIVKFDNTYAQQWATYHGGSEYDCLNNLAIDPAGDILMVGTTYSVTGFPWVNEFDNTNNSTTYTDAYILKMTSSQTVPFCTYFGEDANEEGISIATNSVGEIFVVGNTYSTNSTLISTQSAAPAYQQNGPGHNTNAAGDGFILKYAADCSALLWATYFGGVNKDNIEDIEIDNQDWIHITGYSGSANLPFPGTNPANTFSQSYNGGPIAEPYDGFVSSFDNYGQYVWGTHLGGTKQDWGKGISVDVNSNLFVVGRTASDINSSFPLADGGGFPVYYQPITGGIIDGSITRFDLAPVHSGGNVGIKEIKETENSLAVYPNPTNGFISGVFKNTGNSAVKFIVYNSLGEIVQSVDFGNKQGLIHHTFDLSKCANGIYFLQVQSEKNTFSKMFVKQQ